MCGDVACLGDRLDLLGVHLHNIVNFVSVFGEVTRMTRT